ncbi:MAG: branched-chain amino acid ABC transporter permease [Eubacteriales bacterium]
MFIQSIINGILIGTMYGLAASGLSLIFGVLNIVNFAHGEFIMVGMYITYFSCVLLNIDPLLSLFISIPIMVIIGIIVERLLIKRIIDSSDMSQIFLTVGLGLVLSNLALIFIGGNYLTVQVGYSAESFKLGKLMIAKAQLLTFFVTVIAFVLVSVFLKYTLVGKAIRAISQDRVTAKLMGINTKILYTVAFGIGMMLTAISASLLAMLFPVFPYIGSHFVVICFVIVVLGGLGSLPGALVGGIIVGVTESLCGFYINPGWKDIVPFLVLILFLLIRPQGIFGERV